MPPVEISAMDLGSQFGVLVMPFCEEAESGHGLTGMFVPFAIHAILIWLTFFRRKNRKKDEAAPDLP